MTFDLTTFVFEAVNFVVLVWLMQRLVYRPIRDGIDKRNRDIESRRELAEETMDAANELAAQSEHDRDDLAKLREATLREANEEAAEQRARILAQARDDAQAERSRVRRLLASEREAALSWVAQLAVERGTEAAGLLLMRLAPTAIEAALYDQLESVLKAGNWSNMDLDERSEVEVTVAVMPEQEQLNSLRRALGAALGSPPRLALREDESLRAGLVVRVGHRLLDASVAGQLDAFRDSVRRELESRSVWDAVEGAGAAEAREGASLA